MKNLLVLHSGTYGTLLGANTWPLGLFVSHERCIFTIFLYSSRTIKHNSHILLPIPYSQCYNFYMSIFSQCLQYSYGFCIISQLWKNSAQIN